MFVLIVIFNFIALLLTAVAASSNPTRFNKITVLVALCAFMLAEYQFDTQKFNPLVLMATFLLNLFLVGWLFTLVRDRRHR